MEENQRKQFIDALVQAAKVLSRVLSSHLAVIVGHLERNEYLAALGTYRGLEEHFTFLGTALEAAVRLPIASCEVPEIRP